MANRAQTTFRTQSGSEGQVGIDPGTTESNGQFLRHLRKNGYNTYQDFFDEYFSNKIKYCFSKNENGVGFKIVDYDVEDDDDEVEFIPWSKFIIKKNWLKNWDRDT